MGYRIPNTAPTAKQQKQMKQAVIKLINHFGGLSQAALELGVNKGVLNGWRTRGRVPAYQAESIGSLPGMEKDGLTKEYMRPDVQEWNLLVGD